jgi:hypothetical protein
MYWEQALTNLKKARDRVARRYDRLRSEMDFQVGDVVCVRLHPQSSKPLNRSAKISAKWSDPLVIANFLTKVTVQLFNSETGVLVKRYFGAEL